MPSLSMVSLKTMRSSPRSMASTPTPMTLTSNFPSTPSFESFEVMFRPFCPPRFGNTASGRSFSIILATVSAFRGSIYVISAISGSVIIVAGLEFTSTIS